MARLELIGGMYKARSIIANAQRCINLYPEANQKDSPVPLTFYQRPGLTVLAQGQVQPKVTTPVRCLYRATNGNGYAAIGQNIYSINQNFVLTKIGQLLAVATTPVKMIDNGTTMLIVDGSPYGFQVTLGTNVFAQIADPTGSFQGATTVDYIDTFMLWNILGTKNFGSTLSNEVVFDALYFGGKTDYADPLITLMVNRHEILLFGALKSEIWYDAGNSGFPFAELPGAYIEHGCVAAYSVASQDISTYWLGQDLQGSGVVYRQRGYETKRISSHAVEEMLQTGGNISDAIGYTYQQGGHVFYVLCFPTLNLTLAYDESTELWHQRCWTDANGNLNRDRTNCAAFMYGKNVVGDWQNGTIYALDRTVYQDAGADITLIRGFPHIAQMVNSQANFPGQMVMWNGKRTNFLSLTADIECGNASLTVAGNVPQIFLRYSDDRGKTFSGKIPQSLGAPGSQAGYLTQPIWRNLGEARDRVFELEYVANGPAALNGAWVDAHELNT